MRLVFDKKSFASIFGLFFCRWILIKLTQFYDRDNDLTDWNKKSQFSRWRFRIKIKVRLWVSRIIKINSFLVILIFTNIIIPRWTITQTILNNNRIFSVFSLKGQRTGTNLCRRDYVWAVISLVVIFILWHSKIR